MTASCFIYRCTNPTQNARLFLRIFGHILPVWLKLTESLTGASYGKLQN
jgi:hypothetical protein